MITYITRQLSFFFWNVFLNWQDVYRINKKLMVIAYFNGYSANGHEISSENEDWLVI